MMAGLNLQILDSIFEHYTLTKLSLTQMMVNGDAMEDTPPVCVFASVDDKGDQVFDVVCIECANNEQIPEALMAIVKNFGIPDWVAVVSDTFVGRMIDGVTREEAGHLSELWAAGDPRIGEELVLVAIHGNDDAVTISRGYERKCDERGDFLDMEATTWHGCPPANRQGDIWTVLTRFMLVKDDVGQILRLLAELHQN